MKKLHLCPQNYFSKSEKTKKKTKEKNKSVHNLLRILGTQLFFKASALRAYAFYKSKCPYVCVFVYLFTFEVPFNGHYVPTSRNQMSNNFRDSESLGKVLETSGLRFENFYS